MKLLIVLGIQEYKEELCQLFKEAQVSVFSEIDIKGYKKEEVTVDPMNWFAGGSDPDFSIMFMTFLEEELIDPVMIKLNLLNKKNEGRKPCHAFQMPVEKYV